MATSLARWVQSLKASPPSGLVISKTSLSIGMLAAALEAASIKAVWLQVEPETNERLFWGNVQAAFKTSAWLVLDVRRDIPAWLYQQLRLLAGNGHLRDYATDTVVAIALSDTRVVVVMAEQELENSSFDTLMAQLEMVYREPSE